MRSMNMLQLVGGVVAAGVVAAGTSAFTTAAGMSSTTTDAFVGGTIAQTVTGGTLDSVKFIETIPGRVAGVSLKFNATTPEDSRVSVTLDGGVVVGGSATGFDCPDLDSSNETICTVLPSPAGYYTTITTMNVAVLPPL